ncbi:MAG: lipocalin family protein [Candidatus Riflebacteria bacterium]|nr:lipocalin family protein [Candidatus Riflebacteria bacterium]
MSFKSKNIFRCLLLCVAVVSALVLTACDHHHHHHDNNGTPQSSSSVSLSIDATDFNVNSSARLQTNNDSDFAVSTTGYDNGQLKTTLTDVKAIASGTKYECRISGLINAYDYRFTFKYKGKPVMENQISKSELQNDAVIPVDVNTSIKTLGYDSWLSKSPSNASFENFKNNCSNQGITDDFSTFYNPDAYKAILNKIAKGENVPLPTKSDVNTDFIPTDDAEKEVSELLGTWYLNTINNLPVVVTDNGDVETLVLNSDRTFTWTNYDMAECPDENPEFWQTEKVSSDLKGTWKYSNGSLTLKVNGNEVSTTVTLKNGELTIIDTDEETHETDTTVYKKTKNDYKPTENKALEGSWYLNTEDGIPVIPNSQGNVETYCFNSDGTFSLINITLKAGDELNNPNEAEYWESAETTETITGTWKYADGKLTLKTDKEEGTFLATLKNAELTITETDEDGTSVSVFKKNKNSYKPIKEAIIGTWYLNTEDNYNVVPNANNEVETWIFKEDGSIELQDYEIDMYPSDENPEYWKTADTGDKESGTWSYKDGKLTILCKGEETSFSINIEDDVLTITEIDEETSKTTNSVYKRTKPSLQ